MGQYFKGRKIGTCEAMYYMRLAEAEELAKLGAADDDGIKFSDYLKDGVTKWRFPFPDEDLEGIDYRNQSGDLAKINKNAYNRGFAIPCPGSVEVNHTTICVGNTLRDGSHNVNIFIPCPHSKEFRDANIKTSSGGPGETQLIVVMEAIRDGKRTTIFECARCGSMQRFDDVDTARIKERATEYFSFLKISENRRAAGEPENPQFLYAMEVLNRVN